MTDQSDPFAELLAALVRTAHAERILEIGTGSGHSARAMTMALPPQGVLITIERDPARAAEARRLLASLSPPGRTSVMVGDAARFLHKVAGPFDLIVQDSDPATYAAMHDRLVRLLRIRGLLVTRVAPEAQDYNEKLAADGRLQTDYVPAGEGTRVAISLKRQD